MLFKKRIYDACIDLLQEKVNEFHALLHELSDGAGNDSKSSAGDKHETARAMVQLEQEKINRQLSDISIQLDLLQQININLPSSTVIKGSLVKTDKGFIFLSVPIGKLKVDNEDVFIISLLSPIGQRLLGTHKGEIIEVSNTRFFVEEVV